MEYFLFYSLFYCLCAGPAAAQDAAAPSFRCSVISTVSQNLPLALPSATSASSPTGIFRPSAMKRRKATAGVSVDLALAPARTGRPSPPSLPSLSTNYFQHSSTMKATSLSRALRSTIRSEKGGDDTALFLVGWAFRSAGGQPVARQRHPQPWRGGALAMSNSSHGAWLGNIIRARPSPFYPGEAEMNEALLHGGTRRPLWRWLAADLLAGRQCFGAMSNRWMAPLWTGNLTATIFLSLFFARTGIWSRLSTMHWTGCRRRGLRRKFSHAICRAGFG